MVLACLVLWGLVELLHCKGLCTILSILRCHIGRHSHVGPQVLCWLNCSPRSCQLCDMPDVFLVCILMYFK